MAARAMDKEHFIRLATDSGFAGIGFCSAQTFDDARRRVARQPPIAERRQLRFAPTQDDARTRSLVVLLWPYHQADTGTESIFLDSYYPASNAAYHAARRLEEAVTACGGFVRANAPYPAREAAVRAGLGIIGHHGLLITPQFGTRVVIILMATDVVQHAPDVMQTRECLRCGRCQTACPVQAIDAQGMSHPERCLRNFMMEGVVVPEAMREKMGMRLLGCDTCQRICPMQKGESEPSNALRLEEFMTADDQAFSASVQALGVRIGKNAARPQRVRAQVALLAGNRGSAVDLPVLHAWADSPFPAVSVHARWAAERIERRMQGLDREEKTGYNKQADQSQ